MTAGEKKLRRRVGSKVGGCVVRGSRGERIGGEGQPSPCGRRPELLLYDSLEKCIRPRSFQGGVGGRALWVRGSFGERTGCPRTRSRTTNFGRVWRSSLPVRAIASERSRASQEAEYMGGRGASSGSSGGSGAGGAAATAAVAVGGYMIGTALGQGGASGSSGDQSSEDEEQEEE